MTGFVASARFTQDALASFRPHGVPATTTYRDGAAGFAFGERGQHGLDIRLPASSPYSADGIAPRGSSARRWWFRPVSICR